jgi:hypothetical protein
MNVPGSTCFGSLVGTLPYKVDTQLIKACKLELRGAENISTPLFIVLNLPPDELSAANQQFDAKAAKLGEVQAKINSLLNTANIGCPGTVKAKELTRLSKEVESEIKKNQEMQASQNREIEGVVARA